MERKIWASLILFSIFLFAISIFGSYNNNVQQSYGTTLTNRQLAQAHLTLGLKSMPNIAIQTTAPQSPYTSSTIDT